MTTGIIGFFIGGIVGIGIAIRMFTNNMRHYACPDCTEQHAKFNPNKGDF